MCDSGICASVCVCVCVCDRFNPQINDSQVHFGCGMRSLDPHCFPVPMRILACTRCELASTLSLGWRSSFPAAILSARNLREGKPSMATSGGLQAHLHRAKIWLKCSSGAMIISLRGGVYLARQDNLREMVLCYNRSIKQAVPSTFSL